MNNILSEKEEQFLAFINEVECASMYEVSYILSEYFYLSERQIAKMINHLRNSYYIDLVNNDKYILAGNRKKENAAKPNKGRIIALQIALSQMHTDQEDRNSLMNMMVEVGSSLVFLSGGVRYDVYCLRVEDIYKISIIQDKYLKKYNRLTNDRFNKNQVVNEIVYFAFDCPEKTEEIMEKMSELNLQIPHAIIILHNKDVSGNITFDMYSGQ